MIFDWEEDVTTHQKMILDLAAKVEELEKTKSEADDLRQIVLTLTEAIGILAQRCVHEIGISDVIRITGLLDKAVLKAKGLNI